MLKEINPQKLVVRVSEALTKIVKKNKYSEEEAFKILENAGLRKCVAFFRREVEEMKIIAAEMQRTANFTFQAAPSEFSDVPEYAEYKNKIASAFRPSEKEW